MDALCLHRLSVVGEELLPHLQLAFDLLDGALHLVLRRHIVRRGIDDRVLQGLRHHAGHGLKLADGVDLVAEELHAHRAVAPVGRVNVHRVAAHAEAVALKGDVVALVTVLHQTAQQLVALHRLSRAQRDHQLGEVVRLAEAVDAAHRRDHDHIPPFEQRAGRAQPQAVDLLVRRGVLGDVGVRMRDIRLGLIVVVVADEVFHRVLGKKLLELRAQLRGERLVVRQHQRGALDLFDHARHREGLARAGHTEQHLLVQSQFDAARKRGNGLRLVAGRLKGRMELEFHGLPPQSKSPLSRRHTKSPSATITWSTSCTPMSASARLICKVVWLSSLLGSATPLGWLCDSTTRLALALSAFSTTRRILIVT